MELKVWFGGLLMQAYLSGTHFTEFREQVYLLGKESLALETPENVTSSNVFLADTGLTFQLQHHKATLFCKMLNFQKYLFPECGKLMLFVLVIPVFTDCLLVWFVLIFVTVG